METTRLLFKPTLPAHSAAVSVRPLRSTDVALLEALYASVSPTTLYQRYFRPYQPPRAELEQLCQLGAEEGAGYLAVVEWPQPLAVGVAHYVIDRQQPLIAEVAFLVADRFQGQGIGRMLLQQMARQAAAQGIHAFKAHVHPANDAMMRVFRRSGLPMEVQFSYGVREVRLTLVATPPAPAWISLN